MVAQPSADLPLSGATFGTDNHSKTSPRYGLIVPKRKPPPAQRVWARVVDREWRVHLVSGEILRLVSDLTTESARQAARSLPVYTIGYLLPVTELTGDEAAMGAELARPYDEVDGFEGNTFALFRGDRGTEAVVIERHH